MPLVELFNGALGRPHYVATRSNHSCLFGKICCPTSSVIVQTLHKISPTWDVCILLNKALSNSSRELQINGCRWVTNRKGCGRKRSWSILSHYRRFYLEKMKGHENLSARHCPNRDLNRAATKFNLRAPSFHPVSNAECLITYTRMPNHLYSRCIIECLQDAQSRTCWVPNHIYAWRLITWSRCLITYTQMSHHKYARCLNVYVKDTWSRKCKMPNHVHE